MFVFARVLQGIGGALMVPVAGEAFHRTGCPATPARQAVVSIAACALFTAQTPFALIAALLFVGGLSRSMQFTCYNSIGFADVPKARMSEASALFSMSFQLAMGMGVTVAALLLRASMTVQGHEVHAQAGDFRVAFIGVALLGILALVDVYRLPTGAGESVLTRA